MIYLATTKLMGWIAATFVAFSQAQFMLGWRKRSSESNTTPKTTSALRVLFLHRDLPLHGGVPQCLINLARSLDPQRIEFHVASFDRPSDEMVRKFRAEGVEPYCIGDRGYFGPARKLRQLLEEHQIDVLVTTTFKAYLCGKMAARHCNVGVAFWFHTVRNTVEGFLRRVMRDFLTRDDPMLFVSRAVREAQLPPGHRAPAEVIYNGVEDVSADPQQQPYDHAMRSVFGIPADALVLAYIAEFVVWKDHATAINTMHELARRNVDAHILLIGTGHDIEAAREMAKAGPASGRIHFLGARSDVRRLLGLVDIYIHTSREEGFGLAVVEAMLAGLPVAAVESTGAVIELIESGRTGILVPPGSATALADAVVSLAGNPALARQMGTAARASSLEKFGLDRFADAIARFLEDSFPSAAGRQKAIAAAVDPIVQAQPEEIVAECGVSVPPMS